jgi:hypothetical protein
MRRVLTFASFLSPPARGFVAMLPRGFNRRTSGRSAGESSAVIPRW